MKRKPTTKFISPSQYAALRGCHPNNVNEIIRNNWSLPHVISVIRVGNRNILEVLSTLNTKDFKQ
jgi:hypothetical protein